MQLLLRKNERHVELVVIPAQMIECALKMEVKRLNVQLVNNVNVGKNVILRIAKKMNTVLNHIMKNLYCVEAIRLAVLV